MVESIESSKENCSHPTKYQAQILSNKDYFFCQNCGIISFIDQGKKIAKTVTAIKPSFYQGKTEIDPVLYFNQMKNESFTPIKRDSEYLKMRKDAIKFLEDNYKNIKSGEGKEGKEDILYKALIYMDTIFIDMDNKKLKEKRIKTYIINCLVLAMKAMSSDDIKLDKFNYIDVFFSIVESDIISNELNALKHLKYHLNKLTVYDVFMQLMYNGVIFNDEIDGQSNNLTFFHNYAFKIFRDIMNSELCLIYHPVQLAFSIIHLTRMQFGLKSKYFKRLKELYNYDLSDYRECINAVNQMEKELLN